MGNTKVRLSRRMPKRYVQKYFEADDITRTEAGKKRTQHFLARQLAVPTDHVEITDGKGILLSRKAYTHMLESPADDRTFLATGGSGRVAYEALEMAYNDVMSGSIQASGHSLVGTVRQSAQTVAEKIAGSGAEKLLRTVQESGVLTALGAVGTVATAAIGCWLAKLGGAQITQGLARDDHDQTWDGARSLFLGTESLAASLAIGSTLGSGPVAAVAGKIASTVATPFAVVHGVIDVGQGIDHIYDGVKVNNKLKMVEGAAEIGMGIGWLAAAFAPTPIVVATSCICLAAKLGVALAKKYKTKKESKAERNEARKEAESLKEKIRQAAAEAKAIRAREAEKAKAEAKTGAEPGAPEAAVPGQVKPGAKSPE